MNLNTLSREAYGKLIGQKLGQSDWKKIEQSRIDAFCDVTEDYQFIHNNPQRARDETPFGGSVAHGFLTLSLVSVMFKDHIPGLAEHPLVINYGLNKVRFLEAVREGSRIRGHFKLLDVTDKGPGRVLLTNEITMEIEGYDKPAMIAELLFLCVAENV